MTDDVDFIRRVRRAIHRRPELGPRRAAHRGVRPAGALPPRPSPVPPGTDQCRRGGRRAPDASRRSDSGRNWTRLPIHEGTDAVYRSRNPGAMHACGHDGSRRDRAGARRRLALAPPAGSSACWSSQQAEETYPSGAPLVRDGIPESTRHDRIRRVPPVAGATGGDCRRPPRPGAALGRGDHPSR